jgi:hypothetical protein
MIENYLGFPLASAVANWRPAVLSSRSTIRTSCAKASKTTFAACGGPACGGQPPPVLPAPLLGQVTAVAGVQPDHPELRGRHETGPDRAALEVLRQPLGIGGVPLRGAERPGLLHAPRPVPIRRHPDRGRHGRLADVDAAHPFAVQRLVSYLFYCVPPSRSRQILQGGYRPGTGGLADKADPHARGDSERPFKDPGPGTRLCHGLNRAKQKKASRAVPLPFSRRYGAGDQHQ